MDLYDGYRKIVIREDAAQGQEYWYKVGEPKKRWSCECGQINHGEWDDCVYCGLDREEDE